ncbi:hypothetical protein ES703_52693 [subsurface metagenome]
MEILYLFDAFLMSRSFCFQVNVQSTLFGLSMLFDSTNSSSEIDFPNLCSMKLTAIFLASSSVRDAPSSSSGRRCINPINSPSGLMSTVNSSFWRGLYHLLLHFHIFIFSFKSLFVSSSPSSFSRKIFALLS